MFHKKEMKATSIFIIVSIIVSCKPSNNKSELITPNSNSEIVTIIEDDDKVLLDSLETKDEQRISDKDEYFKTDLNGMWWTRYFAQRKIYFFDDGTFHLNTGNDKLKRGTFNLINRKVNLEFDSGDIISLDLSGGKDDYSYILTGKGYTYVKEWKK